jgi:hypothetical protein
MKNLRLPFAFFYFTAFALSLLFSACSTPKQVFYFQSPPATPKVGGKSQSPQPVYTASTEAGPGQWSPTVDEEIKTVAISKKELRQLLKQQVRLWKDSVPNKSNNRKVTVTGDKQKLKELKSEVEELKKSVKVENNEDKVVVNYRAPATELSDTAKILLAVGALVILIALFSIPVIGPLLAAILAVVVVVAALALILGYVEIHQN